MPRKFYALIAILLCFTCAPRSFAQELPADAAALVEANRKLVAEIERKATEQTEAAFAELQAKLEKLRSDYTKADKLDEAVAIRDFLRTGVTGKVLKPLGDPGNLTAYRSEVGRVLLFEVTGASGYTTYGTDIYTHDTYLASAAVHAGVLRLGEKGVVKVTILPPQDEFQGTGRNGISTSKYQSTKYECFKVEPVKSPVVVKTPATATGTVVPNEVRKDPGNLLGYRDQKGLSFLFEVTGANDWGIYGSDIYSDDSSLDVAAVHAGLLKVDQTGLIKVTLLGPQVEFKSTSRNGVTSRGWGAYGGSYKIEPGSKLDAVKEAVKEIKGVKDAINAVDALKDALKK